MLKAELFKFGCRNVVTKHWDNLCGVSMRNNLYNNELRHVQSGQKFKGGLNRLNHAKIIAVAVRPYLI